MPIYEYQCADCGERIERIQGRTDPPPPACEVCGGTMTRAVSAPAFQFKGSGWYVTDYGGRKSGEGAADAPATTETPAKTKPDAGSEKAAPAKAAGAAKATTSSS